MCDKLRAHLLSQGIGGVPDHNTAVFDVLQEHGIAQATPDGKAIWRATVTSDTGWTHTFTFLRLAPSLIWDVNENPAPFAGTIRVEPSATAASDAADGGANPTPSMIDLPVFAAAEAPPNVAEVPNAVGTLLSLIDQMPASIDSTAVHPMASAASAPRPAAPLADDSVPDGNSAQTGISHEDSAGEYFLQWLRDGIQSHRLIINDAKALPSPAPPFSSVRRSFSATRASTPKSPAELDPRKSETGNGSRSNSRGCISTRSSGTVATSGLAK